MTTRMPPSVGDARPWARRGRSSRRRRVPPAVPCRMGRWARIRHFPGTWRRDLRGGARAVPRARDDRLPQRRHVRPDLDTRPSTPCEASSTANFNEGRSGMPYFPRAMELREQVRARLGALVSADPLQVALTASTTDGCNIVLAGLELGPSDEIVTTTDEHFGLLGALARVRARVVVVAPEPDAIRAAVTPRTRLLALSQVLWTTGRVLPVRELREATGVPVLVDGAQSVGAIPVDGCRARLPHDLRPEVALRPGLDGGAGRRRPGATAGRRAELLLAGGLRAGRELRAPARARASSRTGGRLVARGPARRDRRSAAWASTMPPRPPSACRELLAARVEVVTPGPARRSSPSGPRGSRPRSSRRSSLGRPRP